MQRIQLVVKRLQHRRCRTAVYCIEAAIAIATAWCVTDAMIRTLQRIDLLVEGLEHRSRRANSARSLQVT
jgi:hypothetical protein